VPEQRRRPQALFDAMKRRCRAARAQADRAGDGARPRFRRADHDARGADAAPAEIGATQAALRDAHLKYHLAQSELLTPQQMQRYAVLPGYGQAGAPAQGHDPRRHHGGGRQCGS
jgi:Spy/CpxP family protein refolding chaperone